MKRLGHSSINTTINIYSHLFPITTKKKSLTHLTIFKKWAEVGVKLRTGSKPLIRFFKNYDEAAQKVQKQMEQCRVTTN